MFLIGYIILIGIFLVVALLSLTNITQQATGGPVNDDKTKPSDNSISNSYKAIIDKLDNYQPSYKVANSPELDQKRINPFVD